MGSSKPSLGSEVTIINQKEEAQCETQGLEKGAEAGTELVSQFLSGGRFKFDHNSRSEQMSATVTKPFSTEKE